MELPDSCKNCNKPKTIHLTQVVDHKAVKLDLCADCPFAAELEGNVSFGALDSLMPQRPAITGRGKPCPACGYTVEDFKKTGRMGCPTCYETFAGVIQEILPEMHRGTRHEGKIPAEMYAIEDLQNQMQELESRMEEAVQSEKYETAAEMRDKLLEIKHQIATRTGKSVPKESPE